MNTYKISMVSGKEHIVMSENNNIVDFTSKLYGLNANTPCVSGFDTFRNGRVVIVSTHVESVELV